MLSDLIRQHAPDALANENWDLVAETISKLNLRSTARKCYSVETGNALASVGVDWQSVTSLIDGDATGRFILVKLASEGVEWAHAMTVPYLRSKQGSILTKAGVDALIDLSSPLLYSNLSAVECQVAIVADAARAALVVIQQRRQLWDSISADIRSKIESGTITSNSSIVSAVQSALS
jgi:hypothetical protein